MHSTHPDGPDANQSVLDVPEVGAAACVPPMQAIPDPTPVREQATVVISYCSFPKVGLDGVTIRPAAFVVLVKKFSVDCDALFAPLVWRVGPLPPLPQADPVAVTTPETSSKQLVPDIADNVRAFAAENVHVPFAVGEPPIVPPKVGEVAKTRFPVPVAPAGVTPPIEI